MPQTNASLIRRVQNPADAESWRQFVAVYEPLLLGYVRSRGLREDDARDVVQQIFLSLLRALPGFKLDPARGRFRTWLWQVACHAIADWARRQRTQTRAEEKWLEQAAALDASDSQELEAEWRAAYRQRVLEVVLERVQAQTQPKTWTCFEQHLRRGRPAAEVAAEVGLTANAVYVHASRVLARVRQECTAEFQEDLGDA